MPEDPVFEAENSSLIDTPISRRTLLAMGAIAGVALSLPALPAHADTPYSDIRSLLFLEQVVLIESGFFTRAALSPTSEAVNQREANALALIAKQDAQLVRWFKAAKQQENLGAAYTFYTPNTSSSWPIPVFKFNPDSFKTRDSLIAAAITMKSTAVGAFHNEVGSVSNSPKMTQALAALAGVQGRHLALLLELGGLNPFVTNEPVLSRRDVAKAYESYGFNWEVMI